MTRIFTTLAFLNLGLLGTTYTFGVVSKLRDAAQHGEEIYHLHFILGLATAISTLLVHCLIFTYFLGTGRWVKEVTLAYRIPDEPLHKLTRELKRGTFPPALFAMLTVIAAAAAGAGAQLREWPWQVHLTLATVGLAVNVWACRVEYRNVTINAGVLDQVLAEVDRIRKEAGLPSNAEALAEEERI
jgi:hypothetical protein